MLANKVKGIWIFDAINNFIVSDGFLCMAALILLAGNAFALELQAYTAFFLIMLYIFLFSPQWHPVLPFFPLCYILPAAANNPNQSKESVLFFGNGFEILLSYGAILITLFALREIYERVKEKTRRGRIYPLLTGLLILSAAYMLSGLGSFGFGVKNQVCAFLEGLSLFLPYLLLSGAVKREKVRSDYFAVFGCVFGLTVMCELLLRYANVSSCFGGTVNMEGIRTGWGINNNLGAMMAITLPCFFSLAYKRKHGGIYLLGGFFVFCGVLLSLSRASVLTAYGIVLLSLIALFFAKKKKLDTLLFAIVIFGGTALAAIFLNEEIARIFDYMISKGLDSSGRIKIYKEGIEEFIRNPIFGHGFYLPEWTEIMEEKNSVFTLRGYHNTVIQLLASCGIVGMAAYSYHRLETFFVFWRNRSWETLFVFLSMVALLAVSLLDCHIFEIGPGLYYSVALVFLSQRSRADRPSPELSIF